MKQNKNKKSHPVGWWTEEHCKEVALLCKSNGELQRKFSGAYNAARKNGWMNSYTWFEKKKDKKNYTKEQCKEIALKYNTLKDFRINEPYAYNRCIDKKWLKDFTWLKHKDTITWTPELCIEIAKKCKTRTEFHNNCGGAWNAAKRFGCLDEIMKILPESVYHKMTQVWKYVIYVYEDIENKVAYVGLTKNIQIRHSNHKEESDKVAKYFMELNLIVPEPRIVYENLSADEAKEKEAEVHFKYKNDGWILLDSEQNLGNLGGGIIKWTREKVLKEASKYETKSEFSKNCLGAYVAALKNGWINDKVWKEIKKPDGYWDYNKCYNAARECKTNSEFFKKYPTAYEQSYKNKWLQEFDWLERRDKHPSGYWTEERCYELAKRYTTLKDFCDENPRAESAARRNNWIDSYTWLKRNRGPWTKDECREVAMLCKTVTEFQEKYNGAYQAATKNRWTKEYTWMIMNTRLKWTKEKCQEASKSCKTLKEFYKKYAGAYDSAKRNNWLNEFTWLERNMPSGYWTEETCYNAAKECKTLEEFKKKYSGGYDYAVRHKWTKTYTWFERTKNQPGYWTYERCLECAKDCKSVKEFKTKYNKAYQAAIRNNWYKDYNWLEGKKTK